MPETSRDMLLLAPIPAVLLGSIVMRFAGVPASMYCLNIVVCVVGLFAVCVMSAAKGMKLHRSSFGLMWAAISGLAMTFLGSPIAGVHRWLNFGFLRIHMGEVLSPLFCMAAAVSIVRASRSTWWLTIILFGGLIACQPDPAQETGLVCGILSIFAFRPIRVLDKWGLSVLVIELILSWWQPDPLGQVPYVEGIVALGAKVSPALACCLIGSLALVPLAAAHCSLGRQCGLSGERARTAAAMCAYFAAIELASVTGRFPVVFAGYGTSPLIGHYIAVSFWMKHEQDRGDCGQ